MPKRKMKEVLPLPEQENLPPRWTAKLVKSDIVRGDINGWRVDEIMAEFTALVDAGYVLKQLGAHFNVHPETIYRWSKEIPELNDILTSHRKVADERVEHSLYDSCFDRTVKEVTIEEDGQGTIVKVTTKTKVIPANPQSMQYWLMNRNNEKWKAKAQVEVSASSGEAIPIRLIYDLDSEKGPENI